MVKHTAGCAETCGGLAPSGGTRPRRGSEEGAAMTRQIVKVMLMSVAAAIATNAAAEEIGLVMREPFELGMTSRVFTGYPAAIINETVQWALPDVLFIGKLATPCRINLVD